MPKKLSDSPRFELGDIAALAVDPNQPDIVFAAPGLGGLLRSEDGGATWRDVSPTELASQVAAVLCLGGPSPAVLAGTQQGLYRSENGGATWDRVITETVASFAAAGPEPRIYAGTSLEGILESGDLGETWKSINEGLQTTFVLVQDLAAAPVSPLPAYALLQGRGLYVREPQSAGGERRRSREGQPIWQRIGAHHLGLAPLAVAVDPTRPQTLYVATFSGLQRSRDAGKTWTHLQPGPMMGFFNQIAVGPRGKTILVAGDSYLYRSTNRGESWALSTEGLPTSPITALAVAPSERSKVYLGSGQGIYVSRDGGETWQPAQQPASAEPDWHRPQVIPEREDAPHAGDELPSEETPGEETPGEETTSILPIRRAEMSDPKAESSGGTTYNNVFVIDQSNNERILHGAKAELNDAQTRLVVSGGELVEDPRLGPNYSYLISDTEPNLSKVGWVSKADYEDQTFTFKLTN